MFAQIKEGIHPGNSGTTRQVVYPTLTPALKEILRTTKNSKATANLQDNFSTTIAHMSNGEKFLDTAHDMPVSMIDSVFAACIRTGLWAKEPPIMEPESVKDKLGIYHFTSLCTNTVAYKNLVIAGQFAF
jgi:hypothetical protein